MSEKENKTTWTPQQAKAIEEKGCHLLVAAGAGSGKTSVLTERILRKIKDGKDIMDFLVVTFTVASAEDMKEKLRKKLLSEYASNPENKHLSSQISKLHFARISTITSFCLDLVKRNFTSLNISPNVRIADENEAKRLFENALDILFDEEFEKPDSYIRKVIQLSGCRGKEKSLENYLEKLYNKLRSHPNYIKVIKDLTKTFCDSANDAYDVPSLLKTPVAETIKKAYDIMLYDLEKIIKKMLEIAENYGGDIEDNTVKGKIHAENAKRFFEDCDFSQCIEALKSIKSISFPKGAFKQVPQEEKDIFDEFKDDLKKRSQKVIDFLTSLVENSISDIKICAEISQGLMHLIIRLDEIYKGLKNDKGVIDFTDSEQFAHSLLLDEEGNRTPLCYEIAASTEEVLVDEYQDTNPLQDSIFKAIANNNNRFMVGDDKQSIYRFRNAYPAIFNNYKRTFTTETEKCVFLRENFRCSEEIIDFTNHIFNFLWGDTYKKEQLILGKKEELPTNSENQVTVKTFRTSLANKESSVYEAKYIGNEINKLMNTYRKKSGERLEYSDIAIILPVTQGVGSIFASVLREMNIPVVSKKQGALIETPEVKLVISILKAINNPEEDIPLASAMNSFFFDFTPDELAILRKNRYTSLYGSVLKCAENKPTSKSKFKGRRKLIKKSIVLRKKTRKIINRRELSLSKKCENFLVHLEELRRLSHSMECKQLIWYIYENEGVLSTIESSEEGELKKNNLLLFYTQAIEYGKREYKTLSSFLKYAENLDIETFAPEGLNSVSIMTIHSSKGLEFPVCFVANAGKSPFGDRGEKGPLLNMDAGIMTPIKDSSFASRSPVFYIATETLEKAEDMEEEKRKLYVALTRAKEKLYIVGSENGKAYFYNAHKDECKNYLSWILTSDPKAIYDETILDEEENYEIAKENTIFETADQEEVFMDIEEETFTYPYEVSVKIPRKLSVSELKNNENNEYSKTIRKKDFISVPSFATETKSIKGTEVGTANHTFMQFASFENCINHGVEAEGERLWLSGMLTEDQFGLLNFKNLRTFFQSSLFKKVLNSENVYREKRFTVADNSKSLLGTGNDTVLVQGVIDLFFENEDGTYTVADYKTDRIKEGEESILTQRYEGQIKYYAKAVEEITGKKVKEGILYSFALGKEISIPIEP